MSDKFYEKQLKQVKCPILITELKLVAYKSNEKDRLHYLKQFNQKENQIDKK